LIQDTKADNGYNGCPRCIEEGEFIDNRLMFPVDCALQTAGNNSTVSDEPVVLPDLPIMSEDLFRAFDEDCLNLNFLKQMINYVK
jgi:hypothetical protein